jgi:hypothetical protein
MLWFKRGKRSWHLKIPILESGFFFLIGKENNMISYSIQILKMHEILKPPKAIPGQIEKKKKYQQVSWNV